MDNLTINKANLRKFGITMAAAFAVIATIVYLRHRHVPPAPGIVSAAFLALGLVLPMALKPVYIFWMKLAQVLSWVNTRIILFVIFYLVLTPIGVLMRLFGNDILDIKIEKGKGSYWKKKEKKPFSPADCLRQF